MLHLFTTLAALSTLILTFAGGLVTSTGAGLALVLSAIGAAWTLHASAHRLHWAVPARMAPKVTA